MIIAFEESVYIQTQKFQTFFQSHDDFYVPNGHLKIEIMCSGVKQISVEVSVSVSRWIKKVEMVLKPI